MVSWQFPLELGFAGFLGLPLWVDQYRGTHSVILSGPTISTRCTEGIRLRGIIFMVITRVNAIRKLVSDVFSTHTRNVL